MQTQPTRAPAPIPCPSALAATTRRRRCCFNVATSLRLSVDACPSLQVPFLRCAARRHACALSRQPWHVYLDAPALRSSLPLCSRPSAPSGPTVPLSSCRPGRPLAQPFHRHRRRRDGQWQDYPYAASAVPRSPAQSLPIGPAGRPSSAPCRRPCTDNARAPWCHDAYGSTPTEIPQYVLEERLAGGGKVAVTQPRRVAAISLARRVAEEVGSTLGDRVRSPLVNAVSFRDSHAHGDECHGL